MKKKLVIVGIVGIMVIVSVAVASMFVGWFDDPPALEEFVEPEVPEKVAVIPKVSVPVKTIKVYPKKLIAKEVDLPPSIRHDESKEVAAVVTVEAHAGTTTVVAVIDKDSGETTLISRAEKPRLFDFVNIKEIGLRFGLGSRGNEADFYGRWTFARVGAFYVAIYGEMSTYGFGEPEAVAMLELTYRF